MFAQNLLHLLLYRGIVVNEGKFVFDEVATGEVEIYVELFEMQVGSAILAMKMSVHHCGDIVGNKLLGKARLLVTAVEGRKVHDSNYFVVSFAHL